MAQHPLRHYLSRREWRIRCCLGLSGSQVGADAGQSAWRAWSTVLLITCALPLTVGSASARNDTPGHSIGRVSTTGDLIVLELADGALGKANLFDLSGHTLRFIPKGSGYRIETGPLRWDSDYGPERTESEMTLHNFVFPFSGQSWKSFLVGASGTIRFGAAEKDGALDPYGRRDDGIVLDRFDQLADAASALMKNAPAICVFLKPRLSGPHYVRELSDRLVVTWDLTEAFGSLLDFTWFRTINRFQAVLNRDGSIDMSYTEMAAKDAIVGIFPAPASGTTPTEVHFSSLTSGDGPFAVAYESFHYLRVPRPQDLSCSVITPLGDHFDFLVYYSDFRVDSQEASSPSDGPVGGNVGGIGDTQHKQTPQILDSRCTKGRFQLGYAQPIYVGANEAQERPPDGAPVSSSHEIGFYARRFAGNAQDQELLSYSYAVGHLGHEVGHRWAAYAAAKINDKTISLGPWPHWAPGLQARVAFPYSLPIEASTLGGGAWQDNFDGTYTQLRDGYFVPAAGYSYLDLYLMGLISAEEVPDFFILTNLVPVGMDDNSHRIYRGDRTNVTIQDVIAAEGPRMPDVAHSQRQFNTGFVIVVEHGHSPTRELIERANGIRQRWIEYWWTTTGRRASMTASPH